MFCILQHFSNNSTVNLQYNNSKSNTTSVHQFTANSTFVQQLDNDSTITATKKILRNKHLYFSQTGECYVQWAWQSLFQPLLQLKSTLQSVVCILQNHNIFTKWLTEHTPAVRFQVFANSGSRHCCRNIGNIAVGMFELMLLHCLFGPLSSECRHWIPAWGPLSIFEALKKRLDTPRKKFPEKNTFSFGHCPNYLTPPPVDAVCLVSYPARRSFSLIMRPLHLHWWSLFPKSR